MYVQKAVLQSHLADISQMECAQIRVTGGTGTGKPATVSLPGAYKV